MTRDQAILSLLIVIGAGFLLAHFALSRRLWRKREWSWALRLLAWLPPLTPVLAWKAAERGLVTLWLALGLGYCLLLWVA